MSDTDTAANPATCSQRGHRWRRFTAALPMRTSLLAVGLVWLLGCAWSFQEQSAFAAAKGFTFPHLLPLVIDGFAVSMAGVSWAASLDARPAIAARLATVVAVSTSSASNGVWAYLRAHHDPATVALGVAVPIAANMAFEVLLAELRRQVQRRRGLPPPVAVPYPRLIRLVLAPWQTFRAWRTMVLAITATEHTPAQQDSAQPGDLGAAPRQAGESAPPITNGPRPQVTSTPPPAPAPLTATTGVAAPEPTPHPPATPLPAGPNHPPRHAARPAPRRSPVKATAVKAAEETLTAAGDTSPMTPGANGHRRPPDLRIAVLAQHLANTQDADEVTGEQVGQLLSMDISPRTGRRLLGAARELLDQHPTPPPRPGRATAQRQRRTPNRDDKKYDKNRPELGWAGLGLAHTRRPGPQDVDNDIAPATISAGQPSGTF
ncbi:MAG: hypothetical protein QOD96_3262 [Pseudonocardiales bacterium]|nr:hypothetical protein [Pseudonocardiales bacterium]